jgi:hypothetical protein
VNAEDIGKRQDIVREAIDEHSLILTADTIRGRCTGCDWSSKQASDPRDAYALHVAPIVEGRLREAGL